MSKVFGKAFLSLMKKQFSRLAKSAASNIKLLVFCLSLGYTGERLIPGLRRKDWVLRALLLAVTSLWPQKLGSRDEIYSERWKLALISDQAKDLAKIVWKAGAVCLTAGFRSFTSGILSKSTVSIEKSFHVTNDLCRESESFTE